MRVLFLIAILAFLPACGGDGDEEGNGNGNNGGTTKNDSSAPDMTDPASVVNAIFTAARTGDTTHLASLCDPTGEGDGDTKTICEMTSDSEDWAEFVKTFGKAKVTGQPTIEGDKAAVDFLFGRDGNREETMKLVRRDGKWYLSSV